MRNRKAQEDNKKETKEEQTEKSNEPKGPYTDRFLQLLIILALLAPYAVLAAIHGITGFTNLLLEGINELHSGDLKIVPADHEDQLKLLLCILSLSTPHVFYYILWTSPQLWLSFCEKNKLGRPVKAFSTTAHFIKLQQAVCFAWWYVEAIGYEFPNDPSVLVKQIITYLSSMNIIRLIFSVELILLGQLFNGAVYQTIGESGVYYGVKFGEPVPWVFGFPFSVMGHPQYRGATISIWGFVFFLATVVSISKGIYAIGCVLTLYYYFSGYVEEFF